MTPCPSCSWPHHAAIAITVTCVKCGATVHINGGNGDTVPRPKKSPEEVAAKKAKRKQNLPRVIRFLESRKQPRPKKTPEEIAAKKAKQAARRKHLPKVISFLESRKQDGERGAGDTLERLLAKAGGRKFKHLMLLMRLPCGCDDRQAWLNEKYPFATK